MYWPIQAAVLTQVRRGAIHRERGVAKRGLASIGVGLQYDREAPEGMPKWQVILNSDPNTCRSRLVFNCINNQLTATVGSIAAIELRSRWAGAQSVEVAGLCVHGPVPNGQNLTTAKSVSQISARNRNANKKLAFTYGKAPHILVAREGFEPPTFGL